MGVITIVTVYKVLILTDGKSEILITKDKAEADIKILEATQEHAQVVIRVKKEKMSKNNFMKLLQREMKNVERNKICNN